MPRRTLYLWYCTCGTRNTGEVKVCSKCSTPRIQRNAQVHASERAVVYLNPATGEYKTPPRADMPMPPQYARDGFERMEIMNMTQWEKEKGVVHEATNFNPGNEGSPEKYSDYKPRPEVIQEVAKDMADAIASGPWTGADRIFGSSV